MLTVYQDKDGYVRFNKVQSTALKVCVFVHKNPDIHNTDEELCPLVFDDTDQLNGFLSDKDEVNKICGAVKNGMHITIAEMEVVKYD